MQNHPHQPWGPQQHQNQQYPNQHPQQYGQGAWGGWGAGVQPQMESGAERLAFIKKVYALFAGSVALSAAGAMVALYAGGTVNFQGVAVPSIVATVIQLPWFVRLLLFFGLIFGASAVRKRPGINVVALFGMAFLLGLLFAPNLFIAQYLASTGGTLSASPIRDAFILAVLMFGGLTGYVAISKKDFSYLGSALSMGVWVILGAILLNIFLGSSVLSLAIASVGLILFGGYVLYDTSRILRSDDRDSVSGAMQLYLDFVNIFLYLLRILSSRR